MYNKAKEPKFSDKGRKSSFESSKDPAKKSAKMEVLEELRGMASQMMGSNYAPSEEEVQEVAGSKDAGSLQKKVNMAIHPLPDDQHDTAHAMGTPDSAQYSDEDDMDIDEIESMIHELEEKRRSKLMGS